MTLAYLVLQAGFLLGYGIHEGLTDAASPVLAKAINLSGTVLDHRPASQASRCTPSSASTPGRSGFS